MNVIFINFFRFCVDFEIFPELVSKNKFKQVLIYFLNNFDEDFVISGNSLVLINYEKFLGILMFISLTFSECETNKRILYFFHRLIRSKGIKIITNKTGSSK